VATIKFPGLRAHKTPHRNATLDPIRFIGNGSAMALSVGQHPHIEEERHAPYWDQPKYLICAAK
jgi:hypothetical protein